MATRMDLKLTNRLAGIIAVLVFSLSACGVDGVATLESVDGVSAAPGVTKSEAEQQFLKRWHHRFPVVDAGTPPPPVIDAGTVVTPGNPGPGDVTFAVDTAQAAHPISRYIYGKNFNGSTWAQEPNLTMNRLGGNRWTAYNWENNASNAGSDFNYQSDSYLGGGATPGEAVRLNVANARAAGGATLVTVPILGWVAADKLGTSVLNQPIASRFFSSVPTKGSAFTYPPNLSDTVVNQDEFVSWLEATFPTAHQDPARELFYSLDNEPDLWAEFGHPDERVP